MRQETLVEDEEKQAGTSAGTGVRWARLSPERVRKLEGLKAMPKYHTSEECEAAGRLLHAELNSTLKVAAAELNAGDLIYGGGWQQEGLKRIVSISATRAKIVYQALNAATGEPVGEPARLETTRRTSTRERGFREYGKKPLLFSRITAEYLARLVQWSATKSQMEAEAQARENFKAARRGRIDALWNQVDLDLGTALIVEIYDGSGVLLYGVRLESNSEEDIFAEVLAKTIIREWSNDHVPVVTTGESVTIWHIECLD